MINSFFNLVILSFLYSLHRHRYTAQSHTNKTLDQFASTFTESIYWNQYTKESQTAFIWGDWTTSVKSYLIEKPVGYTTNLRPLSIHRQLLNLIATATTENHQRNTIPYGDIFSAWRLDQTNLVVLLDYEARLKMFEALEITPGSNVSFVLLRINKTKSKSQRPKNIHGQKKTKRRTRTKTRTMNWSGLSVVNNLV